MIKVGITGQSGFIGTNLYNYLSLKKTEIELIPFEDNYFDNFTFLEHFVSECDTIVHLAAMNRHNEEKILFETNISLVNQMINACQKTNSKPHLIFSSSIQEDADNLYGKSKLEGRKLFENWAEKNNAPFTGLIIPNVFGPFGNPYYNSVIATFCHQLTHQELPVVKLDNEIKLIYIGELVESIYNIIVQKNTVDKTNGIVNIINLSYSKISKVSELLELILKFKNDYFENRIFPDLSNPFHLNLFNTFVCYIDHARFFPSQLTLNSDNRGAFVETVKSNSSGQVSFSVTNPGITRGNHFHTRKIERFAVLKGNAVIELRRIGSNNKMSFELNGNQPSFVDIPIWHTHNITNVGQEDLYTLFWISEIFNPEDADTFYEEV